MKSVIQITFNVAIAVVVSYLLVKSFYAEKKVVYIETSRLVLKYKGTEIAQRELESKTKSWQANVDTLTSEFEDEFKKFEREQSSMTQKERKLSEQLLYNKQQQLMQYQQAMKEKVELENKKVQEKVLNELNSFLKEYGERHSYDYILGASNYGNIVYAGDALDITDQVIEEINKGYQRK